MFNEYEKDPDRETLDGWTYVKVIVPEDVPTEDGGTVASLASVRKASREAMDWLNAQYWHVNPRDGEPPIVTVYRSGDHDPMHFELQDLNLDEQDNPAFVMHPFWLAAQWISVALDFLYHALRHCRTRWRSTNTWNHGDSIDLAMNLEQQENDATIGDVLDVYMVWMYNSAHARDLGKQLMSILAEVAEHDKLSPQLHRECVRLVQHYHGLQEEDAAMVLWKAMVDQRKHP